MYQFILDEPLSENLENMLREAFAGESKAYVRNLAFARRADQDGYPQIARLFKAVAEAERVHAEEYLKYLEGVVEGTEKNLRTAFENEMLAKREIYPLFIKEAIASKREDLSWSFIRSRDVEDRHAKLYKEALSALASEREVDYHVCKVCGYVFTGAVPDSCPVCRSSEKDFKKIV